MMIEIIDIKDVFSWNERVKSFVNHDVYYLSGYVKAFMVHGDGLPQLLYYESDSLRAMYVYMKRATALPGVFDSITPYGYGGVLFEGETSSVELERFWNAYLKIMEEEHIVDNFVRYHPMLQNAVPMKAISSVVDLGKTVAMDLSSPEIIWDNLDSKNRNMIRKAEKNGVEIHHGKGMDLLEKFRIIYNATMLKDQAEPYYFFEEKFYQSIDVDLHDHYEMFYAKLEERIIAMSIVIFANQRMHYHLSGSDIEYRNLAPTNLLLYKAALWGCGQGFKAFHLGGGVGSGEDNLYKFKSVFNRHSDCLFSIGKQIFNQNSYNELVEIRKKNDASFNENSSYFPLYRS